MSTFEVKGNQYSIGRLDAFAQLHICRRLAPLVQRIPASGGISYYSIIGVLQDASNEDLDYIIVTSLRAVKRQTGGAWSAVIVGNTLAFEDIDAADMLEIVSKGVGEYVTPFFTGLAKLVSGTAEQTSDS